MPGLPTPKSGGVHQDGHRRGNVCLRLWRGHGQLLPDDLKAPRFVSALPPAMFRRGRSASVSALSESPVVPRSVTGSQVALADVLRSEIEAVRDDG